MVFAPEEGSVSVACGITSPMELCTPKPSEKATASLQLGLNQIETAKTSEQQIMVQDSVEPNDSSDKFAEQLGKTKKERKLPRALLNKSRY